MISMIQELWHGNVIPQEDGRTNSKEMKELLGYMSRHHEDLEKSFTDEQKEIFEKFHDCFSYLRKKLTSLDANIHIKSSRNAGYSLEEKQ